MYNVECIMDISSYTLKLEIAFVRLSVFMCAPQPKN